MLTNLKSRLRDLLYGGDYVSIRCSRGCIYCVLYQDHKLEKFKMSNLLIDVDISGMYNQTMADVWIKINGLK